MGLKHTKGRVIVMVDLESKNSHRFSDGKVIRLERKYNQFNRRISEPVNATVISAESMPEGCEILIGHNSLHETNLIRDYRQLSGAEIASSIRYYSISEEECFAYRDTDGIFKPCKEFQFGLRVFRPYLGSLVGIEPELVKEVLYCTTGKLKGKVLQTLKACDYEIVYQGENGQEQRLIRFRHSDEEELVREEIVGIRNEYTDMVNNGELLVGLTPTDAKTAN